MITKQAITFIQIILVVIRISYQTQVTAVRGKIFTQLTIHSNSNFITLTIFL